MTASTLSTPATGLQPDDIVDVALALISEHGLEWFSMRKLAAALDVNPMTVYLRFENKDELLDAVARRGLADLAPPALGNGPWDERATRLCVAIRAHLLADRNLLGLYASTKRLSVVVLHGVEQGLLLMEEIGYRDEGAVRAFRALFWHTVGFTLVHHDVERFPADTPGGLEAAVGPIDPASHPTFARNLPSFTSVDSDHLFDYTTRLIVTGLLGDAPTPLEHS